MLYLASNSPRRRELLSLTGLQFERLSPSIDETPQPGEAPEGYVLRLAREKAQAAVELAPAPGLILAADTSVALEDQILGKPADAAQAREMLRALRGRTHQVYTALALLRMEDDLLWAEVCVSQVQMRAYSEDEMEAYIASGDPFDKAGAYAIQHRDFHPVEHFNTCYANVMGLPLCHLVRALRVFEIQPAVEVPQGCQAALDYACPVYASILGVQYPE
ncbi:MAG TPA: Maf family protein [Anaerolineaceae bacterium]|nr:Maf family protein [Anaerolineaceae bacterium]